MKLSLPYRYLPISLKVYQERTHPIVSCFCCILHVLVYAALGWTLARFFGLELKPDFTIGSAVSFTRPEFDSFLQHAVPLSIYVGAAGLLLACLISLLKAVRQYTHSLTSKTVNVATVLVYSAVAAAMFGISLPSFTASLDRATYDRIPGVFKDWDRSLDKFHLASSYGLFRRMTGVGGRPEIIIGIRSLRLFK